ncbi:MAG TPA: ABC transporter substrate-binding protein [Burkholderiales bacterium]|jgi:ABC-type nitrate/sulfonate/bicarbonate transport system substrate-binding protein
MRSHVLARAVARRLFALAAPLAVLGAADAGAQTVPLRVAYIPAATWTIAWVAQDQGIFAKHGLNVTFTQVQNISLLPPTVGKQIDIAPATPPDLIKSAGAGLDVVGVAGGVLEVSDQTGNGLVVRKDSGITSIAQLKGKTIATPTLGAILHVAALHWLKKSGVEPSAIRAVEVPFPNMADQLKAGRVDAVETTQPFLGQMLANGDVSLGSLTMAVADPSRTTVWIAQGAWARSHPAVLKQWVEALNDAKAYIAANPGPTRAVIAKYTHLAPQVVEKLPIPNYEAHLTAAQLTPWIKAMREVGQLPRDVDAAKLVIDVK